MASLADPLTLDKDGKRLARRLTQLLRHGKPRKLTLRSDGFIDLDQVRTVPGFDMLTLELARAIVREDNKERFALREEGGRWVIRANQGHTIRGLDDNLLLTKVEDPDLIPVVVHGTNEEAWNLIAASGGLSRMKRNHVHFASGLPKENGVISGMRSSAEVLIYVNSSKAMASGLEFFKSANGVILTAGLGAKGIVPSSCFERVVRASTGELLQADACARQGGCAVDLSCTDITARSEEPSEIQQTICRYWIAGTCRNGNECKWVHADSESRGGDKSGHGGGGRWNQVQRDPVDKTGATAVTSKKKPRPNRHRVQHLPGVGDEARGPSSASS